MKLKKLTLFYILICTVLIIYVLYFIYNLLYSSRLNNQSNKFEDIPAPSQTPAQTPVQIPGLTSMPTEEPVEQCSISDNIVGVCMNYAGCCNQMSENNKCFCNHPFLQDCKKTYDECKKSSTTSEECKSTLKECCTAYNKINIDIDNFNKPIKQDQTSQRLCSIGTLNGLSTDSLRLKCMELCQTNTDCKAFSINDMNCILFNGINPLPTSALNKSKSLTDYYIKK
jgi:hypothetical protein